MKTLEVTQAPPNDSHDNIARFVREDAPVDRRGRAKINEFIASRIGGQYVLPSNIRTELWDWRLVNHEGKIAKRFKRYLKDEGMSNTAIRDHESLISEIGQIAADHADTRETFWYTIADSFFWNDGEFGDEGSCFWGCNSHHKDMIEENGGRLICFYEVDFFGRESGIGRAILLPFDSGWILFNVYGKHKIVKIARVLAGILECDYKQIHFTCNVWVNGNSGYYLFPHGEIERDFLELRLDDGTEVCYRCENRFDRDDLIWSHVTDNEYCTSCFDRLFGTCDYCNESVYRDDLYHVDGDWWCRDCINDSDAVECTRCCEYTTRPLFILRTNGEELPVCDSHCRHYISTKCDHCEEYIYDRDSMDTHILLYHPEVLESESEDA